MINSDILQDVTLVSGGYVQRSGNRTGASVEFNVALGIARAAASARGGERDRRLGRRRGTACAAQRGSWLVSARQSYLDLVIDAAGRRSGAVRLLRRAGEVRLRPQRVPARCRLTVIAGRSRLKEPENEVDTNDLYRRASTPRPIGIGQWQWTRHAQRRLSAGVMGGVNRFRNETIGGIELDDGREAAS